MRRRGGRGRWDLRGGSRGAACAAASAGEASRAPSASAARGTSSSLHFFLHREPVGPKRPGRLAQWRSRPVPSAAGGRAFPQAPFRPTCPVRRSARSPAVQRGVRHRPCPARRGHEGHAGSEAAAVRPSAAAASGSAACRVPRPARRRGCRPPADPEQLAQDPECHAVGRVVEGRHQDGGVADVEVRVARRKPTAVEDDRRRHGQVDHLRPRAVGEPRVRSRSRFSWSARGSRPSGPLPAEDDRLRATNRRGRPRGRGCRRRRCPCRARSRASPRGPGRPPRSRRARSRDCGPGRGVEQALLGGEDRAVAVHVDGAALEHDRPARWTARRSCRSRALAARSAIRSSLLWSGYLAQPLKRKRATATSGSGCSRRTQIGPMSRVQPRSVGQRKNSTRPVRRRRARGPVAPLPRAPRGTRMRTISPSASLRRSRRRPRDGREAPRPVREVVRPAEPGGLVRLPLRRHAEGLDVGVEGGARQGLYSRSMNRRSMPA